MNPRKLDRGPIGVKVIGVESDVELEAIVTFPGSKRHMTCIDTDKYEALQTDKERLTGAYDKLKMDLDDMLDLKGGHGPIALALARVEVENLRAVLTDIDDRVAIWKISKLDKAAERLRWQFLGQLARKALQREQS